MSKQTESPVDTAKLQLVLRLYSAGAVQIIRRNSSANSSTDPPRRFGGKFGFNLTCQDPPNPSVGCIGPNLLHALTMTMLQHPPVSEWLGEVDYIAGIPPLGVPFSRAMHHLLTVELESDGFSHLDLLLNSAKPDAPAESIRFGIPDAPALIPRAKVLLVNTLAINLQSILAAKASIEAQGLQVIGLCHLINMESGEKEKLALAGISAQAPIDLSEILSVLHMAEILHPEEYQSLVQRQNSLTVQPPPAPPPSSKPPE